MQTVYFSFYCDETNEVLNQRFYLRPCLRFALRPKQFKEVIAAFNPKKDEPTVNSSVGNHFGSATVYVQPFLSKVSLRNDDFVAVNQITEGFDSVEFRPVFGWYEEDDRPKTRNAL